MSNGPPAQRRRCSRKKTEAPTPSFFGLMHRNIGALHQGTHIVAVMRIKGDANTWCRTQRMVIDQIGLRYAAQNFVGDHGGIIRSLPFPQTQLTLAAGKTAKCPLQINDNEYTTWKDMEMPELLLEALQLSSVKTAITTATAARIWCSATARPPNLPLNDTPYSRTNEGSK